MIRIAPPALFPLLLLAAGCSRDATVYPSLSPRPIEKLGFAEPDVTPATAKPDPALDAKIADMANSLDRIASGFAADLATAERSTAAAKGKPVGSDPWLAAQTGLAGLDDWRAQTSTVVTDIDTLAVDRAAALDPVYPALASLHDRAQAEADRQGAAIGRLQAALPSAG